MGIEKETIANPCFDGVVRVATARRGASGAWSADLDLNLRIQVGDGREVLIRKHVSVKATEQIGRKPKRAR